MARKQRPIARTFGAVGESLWNENRHKIDDGAEEILRQACFGADRAAELAARINADGLAVTSQTGALRPHPCLQAELQARAFVCRQLDRLGLVKSNPVGRPSTPVGITYEQLQELRRGYGD